MFILLLWPLARDKESGGAEMEVRNCRKCGRIFNYVAGMPICPACRERIEEKFQEVKKRYLMGGYDVRIRVYFIKNMPAGTVITGTKGLLFY